MFKKLSFFVVMFCASLSAMATNDYQQCLLQAIESASDSVTISELKAGCQLASKNYKNGQAQAQTQAQTEGGGEEKALTIRSGT